MEAKKSLGQHFLHDEGILDRIKKEIGSAKRIVEIGGGRGALTKHLLELNVPITVVEIDDNLSLYLKERFEQHGVEVKKEDAALFKLKEKSVVVGNLPYNVSKRIIKNMILQKEKVEKMVFMLQKEVADCAVAIPGIKEYTKFSVFVQMFCKVKRLFNVKRGAFNPPPKVESSVVEFVPFNKNAINKDIDSRFFDFLDILFSHPRKTVRNNIKNIMKNGDKIEHYLNKRPKELSLNEIYKVFAECCL